MTKLPFRGSLGIILLHLVVPWIEGYMLRGQGTPSNTNFMPHFYGNDKSVPNPPNYPNQYPGNPGSNNNYQNNANGNDMPSANYGIDSVLDSMDLASSNNKPVNNPYGDPNVPNQYPNPNINNQYRAPNEFNQEGNAAVGYGPTTTTVNPVSGVLSAYNVIGPTSTTTCTRTTTINPESGVASIIKVVPPSTTTTCTRTSTMNPVSGVLSASTVVDFITSTTCTSKSQPTYLSSNGKGPTGSSQSNPSLDSKSGSNSDYSKPAYDSLSAKNFMAASQLNQNDNNNKVLKNSAGRITGYLYVLIILAIFSLGYL